MITTTSLSSTFNRRQSTATSTPSISRLSSFNSTLPLALLNPTSPTNLELQTNLRLLHLLHYRNRNQHRRGVWYRHFSHFRREISRFCQEVGIIVDEKPGSVRSGNDGRVRGSRATGDVVENKRKLAAKESSEIGGVGNAAKRRKTEKGSAPGPSRSTPSIEAIQRATSRLTHWVTSGQIPKWHAAITTLSATPSFSPLSLTLLAIFSRTMALTGAISALNQYAAFEEARGENEYAREVGEVLARFGKEWDGQGYTHSSRQMDGETKDIHEDTGVKVSRADDPRPTIPQISLLSSARSSSRSSLSPSQQSRLESRTNGTHNEDTDKLATKSVDLANQGMDDIVVFEPSTGTTPHAMSNEPAVAAQKEHEVVAKKRKKKPPRNAIDALFAGS